MKHYKDYWVTWEIDIAATSMEEAARIARDIQSDPHSLATYFTVMDRKSGENKIINVGEGKI